MKGNRIRRSGGVKFKSGEIPVRDIPVRDIPVRDIPVMDIPVRGNSSQGYSSQGFSAEKKCLYSRILPIWKEE